MTGTSGPILDPAAMTRTVTGAITRLERAVGALSGLTGSSGDTVLLTDLALALRDAPRIVEEVRSFAEYHEAGLIDRYATALEAARDGQK